MTVFRTPRLFISSLLLVVSAQFGMTSSALADDGALFTYKGKTYKTGDLTMNLQQSKHDIDAEHFEKLKRLAEMAVLDAYFAEEATKTKKTTEQVETAFNKVDDPSEKDVQEWYAKNKERVPYPLEQIKDEVKKFLVQEKLTTKRTKLIEELKKKGSFALAMKEPTAPVVTISTDGYPTTGPAGAKVAIVEFADYQCPHCRATAEPMRKALDHFKDKVRFTYMDYPINPSGVSLVIAQGSHCAAAQNKFWEYHKMAFEKQQGLTKESPKTFAKDLKLDQGAFEKCLADPSTADKVAKAKTEGERVGITGTPTVFINGRKVNIGHEEDAIVKEIEKALKG